MIEIPVFKIGDPIEVIWIDAHFQAGKGWISEEELRSVKMIAIRSICQFFDKDENYLFTVADRSQEEGDEIARGVMRDLKIPLGCIISIRKL